VQNSISLNVFLKSQEKVNANCSIPMNWTCRTNTQVHLHSSLTFGTSGRWGVSFMPQLYSRGQSPRYALHRRLCVTQRHS